MFLKMGHDVMCEDNEGKTILHLCAELGTYNALKFLLPKVTNINVKDNFGNTPMHYASEHYARTSNLQSLKLLLYYNADPNVKVLFFRIKKE